MNIIDTIKFFAGTQFEYSLNGDLAHKAFNLPFVPWTAVGMACTYKAYEFGPFPAWQQDVLRRSAERLAERGQAVGIRALLRGEIPMETLLGTDILHEVLSAHEDEDIRKSYLEGYAEGLVEDRADRSAWDKFFETWAESMDVTEEEARTHFVEGLARVASKEVEENDEQMQCAALAALENI